MAEKLRNFLARLAWRRIKDPRSLPGVVLLHWQRASGPVVSRPGIWQEVRAYEGKVYGPGFTCWWTGKPLADGMTHWMRADIEPLLRSSNG